MATVNPGMYQILQLKEYRWTINLLVYKRMSNKSKRPYDAKCLVIFVLSIYK